MFKVMAPYLPAPPPGSPSDWGKEERVRELLGGDFDLDLEEHLSTLRMPSAEAYWQLVTSYGPTKTLAEGHRRPAGGSASRLDRFLRDELRRGRRDPPRAGISADLRRSSVGTDNRTSSRQPPALRAGETAATLHLPQTSEGTLR